MGKISVCMIVRDEAEHLTDCIESMKRLWDELIVVDTGSTDNTVDIAESFGARVEHFEWCDDYSAARNYAESFAIGDYIFWIDGDETLVEGHDVIREVVENGEASVRPSCRDGGLPHLRQELLRKRGNGEWQYPIHESLTCDLGRPEPRIVYQHHVRNEQRDPQLDDRWPALRKRAQALDFMSLNYLAREYGAAGRYVECVALAELALSQPHEHDLDASDLAIALGNAYRHLDHEDRAEDAYRRSLTEHDGWAEPYYMLAATYVRRGRPDRAVPLLCASLAFNQVAGHAPYGEELYRYGRHSLLGRCYASQGLYPQALAILTDAQQRGAAVGEVIREVETQLRKVKRNQLVVAR